MSDADAPKTSGKFGTYIIIASAVVGAVWVVLQIIGLYSQKQEKVVAIGSYADFAIPEKYETALYDKNDLLSKTVHDLEQKRAVELKWRTFSEDYLHIMKAIESREDLAQARLKLLKDVHSYVEISVTNLGQREAQNISVELDDATGYYQVGDAVDSPKGEFKKSIPVGNIRPTLTTKIYVWTFEQHYPWRRAFVSYSNGSETIKFPQDETEITWTWFDYVWYSVVGLIVLSAVFGIGYAVGNKEWRAEMAEEQEVLKKFREEKKARLAKSKQSTSLSKPKPKTRDDQNTKEGRHVGSGINPKE